MIALIFLIFAVVALVAGGAGGYFIARKLSGVRAWAVLLLWLVMPFVVLAFAFSSSIDPTLTQRQASYDFAMAWVLTSLVIAVPWFGANLVGVIMGRNRRKAGPKIAAVFDGPSGVQPAEPFVPPADPDYPDWRQYDQPSLSLDQLGELMRGIAVRAKVDQQLLPKLGGGGAQDGIFLDRDKFDYIYIGRKDGAMLFDHRVVIADQAMYLIFSDLAGKQATDAERQAFLAALDRRWGNEFARERAGAAK